MPFTCAQWSSAASLQYKASVGCSSSTSTWERNEGFLIRLHIIGGDVSCWVLCPNSTSSFTRLEVVCVFFPLLDPQDMPDLLVA